MASEGIGRRERAQEAGVRADAAQLPAGPAAGEAMKVAVAILIALVLPASAVADPPSRVTVVAVFDPLTYGETAYVNGQLVGDNQGGQLVAIEQATAPLFADWTTVAQTTADAAGYYSFKLHPSQTMQYRTNTQGIASDRSVQVSVAPRIKLKAE